LKLETAYIKCHSYGRSHFAVATKYAPPVRCGKPQRTRSRARGLAG